MAVLIAHAHRRAVQLRLSGVVDIANKIDPYRREPLRHPPIEIRQFFVAERIIQGQHGPTVRNRAELSDRCGPNALSR